MAGYYVRGDTIYVRGTVDGKYYRLSTGKKANRRNIKWIEKNWREVLLKLVQKEKPSVSKNFAEYARRILEITAHTRSETTNRGYKIIFDKHILPYFKHFALHDFKPVYIKEWQAKLLEHGLTPKTIKNARIVLSLILNSAVEDELIDKNPLTVVKAPKSEKVEEIEVFSLDEVGMLIENASGWFKNFLIVAFFTGMRTGELLALRFEDLDYDERIIEVKRSRRQGIEKTTKTGKSRIIDMLNPVYHALKEQEKNRLERQDHVFVSSHGDPFFESSVIAKRHWKRLLQKCGLKYRKLYSTRHTFASIMLQQGEELAWISKMLGHSDISTTLKYYARFIRKKGIKRAAFLDDFSQKFSHNFDTVARKMA